MKRFLVCILILKGSALYAQNRNDTLKVVATPVGINFAKRREEKLKAYVDSVSNYKGGVVPEFLFNECFDWTASLWEGMHSPVSLRWKILAKVNNKKALKMILRTNDRRLKQICSRVSEKGYPDLEVPMIKKSTYQLIEERYKEL